MRRKKRTPRFYRLRPFFLRDVGVAWTITDVEWNELIFKYGHRCYHCGKPWTQRRRPTLDRIIPGIYGGGYTKDNLVPSCAHCNFSRGSKTITEFHAWRRAKKLPVREHT